MLVSSCFSSCELFSFFLHWCVPHEMRSFGSAHPVFENTAVTTAIEGSTHHRSAPPCCSFVNTCSAEQTDCMPGRKRKTRSLRRAWGGFYRKSCTGTVQVFARLVARSCCPRATAGRRMSSKHYEIFARKVRSVSAKTGHTSALSVGHAPRRTYIAS